MFAQTDPFTATDAITLGIASIGALTGIAALAITASQFWLSGARLRVKISAGWLASPRQPIYGEKSWDMPDVPQLGDESPRIVVITVDNFGRMSTTIIDWGIVEGKHGQYYSLNMSENPRPPVRIEPGVRQIFSQPLEEVIAPYHAASAAQGQRRGKVSAAIRLGDGRELRSRKLLEIPTD